MPAVGPTFLNDFLVHHVTLFEVLLLLSLWLSKAKFNRHNLSLVDDFLVDHDKKASFVRLRFLLKLTALVE